MQDTDTLNAPGLPGLSPPAEEPAFATLVTTDGTLIRLHRTRFDEIVVRVGGREAKVLDRFQVAALRVAMIATAEG
jgi:hypothetical protein